MREDHGSHSERDAGTWAAARAEPEDDRYEPTPWDHEPEPKPPPVKIEHPDSADDPWRCQTCQELLVLREGTLVCPTLHSHA